jgi:hypothetical protein
VTRRLIWPSGHFTHTLYFGHNTNESRDVISGDCGDKIVGRHVRDHWPDPVTWPFRSPNLTPSGITLWSHVKVLCMGVVSTCPAYMSSHVVMVSNYGITKIEKFETLY